LDFLKKLHYEYKQYKLISEFKEGVSVIPKYIYLFSVCKKGFVKLHPDFFSRKKQVSAIKEVKYVVVIYVNLC